MPALPQVLHPRALSSCTASTSGRSLSEASNLAPRPVLPQQERLQSRRRRAQQLLTCSISGNGTSSTVSTTEQQQQQQGSSPLPAPQQQVPDGEEDVLIEFKDVYKSFGPKPILAGASFKIRRGEAVGIIGASGTGKSTTLRIAAGLLAPDKGDIYIHGKKRMGLISDSVRVRWILTGITDVFGDPNSVQAV